MGTTRSRQTSPGKSLAKVALAAGSATFIFSSFGPTSFAAANSPSDLVPCSQLGTALPPVGELCSTVTAALPSAPALPTPPLPTPSLPSAPDTSTIPVVGQVIDAVTGSGTPSLPTPSLPTPSLPSLGDLGSGLPTGGTGTPSLPSLPSLDGIPVLGSLGSGLPSGGAGTPSLPSLDALPTVVPTVIGTLQPGIDQLHAALPTSALPDLPTGDLQNALAPAVIGVTGAVSQVGGAITGAAPQLGPVINPVVATINGLPVQVAALLNSLLSKPATPTPTPGLPGTPGVTGSGTVSVGGEVATDTNAIPAGFTPERAASQVASEPAVGAAPGSAVSPAGGTHSSGSSLPITGISIAGVGLAGAIAMSWGAFARALAGRKRLVPGS